MSGKLFLSLVFALLSIGAGLLRLIPPHSSWWQGLTALVVGVVWLVNAAIYWRKQNAKRT